MFGFLRRKRPAEGVAAPSPAPAPVPEAAASAAPPAGGPASALYPGEVLAGPVEATTATARPAAVQAPAVEAPLPIVATPAFDAGAPASVVENPPERRSWMKRLREGLSKTRGNLAGLFSGARVDDALFEELESALLASDAGVATTDWLMRELQQRVRRERLTDGEQVRQALRALTVELLAPLEKPMDIDRAEPLVLMIAGVNGAGKTTSIGKLAHHLRREGKSILLAAGDTFRAAAREQLAEWGSRNDVEVIAQQGGDPAAVAFDAVSAGRARRTGVVMIDTAGRLPTQLHLMEELKKIRRVVAKAMDGAPHETLLVLDGNTGQNMLAQVKAFDDAIGLSGLIVTKLDGTAKGGAIAALAHTRRDRPIPVYFVGVGEGLEDLQAFSADEFASALFD
jgi:fused signal recognition particle receptor